MSGEFCLNIHEGDIIALRGRSRARFRPRAPRVIIRLDHNPEQAARSET